MISGDTFNGEAPRVDPGPRPVALPVKPDAIPDQLKENAHFVVWRYTLKVDKETDEAKWDKPPTNARTGRFAKSTSPATWSTFTDAIAAMERGGYDGIGYVLHKDKPDHADPFIAIDLDKCRDPDSGQIEPWAIEIIQVLNSYTELSPSSKGIRILVRGRLPRYGRKKGAFEIYENARYVTITGHHLHGTPSTIEDRQVQVETVHRKIFLSEDPSSPRKPSSTRSRANSLFSDHELIAKARKAENGEKFSRLYDGSIDGYDSHSNADQALCGMLAFWLDRDPARIDAAFRASGLYRDKWERQDYRERTINKAISWCDQTYAPGAGSQGPAASQREQTTQEQAALDWEQVVPIGEPSQTPPLPLKVFPRWLGEWIAAEAEATQTPPDLPAMIALGACAAGIARKFRVTVRPGWDEPTNLYTAVALPPGDRKSAVFADAMKPVLAYEHEEQERMAPVIAELASEYRMLETRLKELEGKAAKAPDAAEQARQKAAARDLAKKLAAHVVPELPQSFCDDITAEALAKLLAKQGGRMLLASPEGTVFEIAKGRYSDAPNFDVYLKVHAGDPLRVSRISRARDTVHKPALTLALAVQPDVIRGLADQASMKRRGFLARVLYSMPTSLVGKRRIAPAHVPPTVDGKYYENVLRLWRLPAPEAEGGKYRANELSFSSEAEALLREFETWLEPQLAQGEDLSLLAGWASKLSGAIARIAAVFNLAAEVDTGLTRLPEIEAQTVENAIKFGRDYLLPHAQTAFGVMGADPRVEPALALVKWFKKHCSESNEFNESAPLTFTRRQIHQHNRRRFKSADDLEPALELLRQNGYLAVLPGSGQAGRGHRSPVFQVNPTVLAASTK
jgi:hypothetical protein